MNNRVLNHKGHNKAEDLQTVNRDGLSIPVCLGTTWGQVSSSFSGLATGILLLFGFLFVPLARWENLNCPGNQ